MDLCQPLPEIYFFLPSYQLNRLSRGREKGRSSLGKPSVITFKMIRRKHKSGWKELRVRLPQNWKNKLHRGIAHSIISYQTLYVTFTLGRSLRLMLRARCLWLITYSIRVYRNQSKEMAVSLITYYSFVRTSYKDLGNSGEYIKSSVTICFLPNKYSELIQITFFFFKNSKSQLFALEHAIAISHYHISLVARNCSFRVDVPQDRNFLFARNLAVRSGKMKLYFNKLIKIPWESLDNTNLKFVSHRVLQVGRVLAKDH